MADNLIFPIGFDLESGLKTAETDFKRVARQIESAIKKQSINIPIGVDETTAKKLREEAKDIERVLANIKNNYGKGQLRGLSIGFINTQKEIDGIKTLESQLQALQQKRISLVNAGATIDELKRVDAAVKQTELRLKMLNHAFNRDMFSNVAISQQIVKLKYLAENLADIDRKYARLQASASVANESTHSLEANNILARRKELMEEIARITQTAAQAQKELFSIKGVGIGASQGAFGIGGEQGMKAISGQILHYEKLKKELQEVEGQYERLRAMQAQGMGDQSEKINQVLQRRIAIQKELSEITQTAAQAQKELEKRAAEAAAAFQRGRGAIENFNRVMKLPENRIMNIQKKIDVLNQALQRVGIGSAEFYKITSELNRLGKKLDEAKAKQEALAGVQKKTSEEGSNLFQKQGVLLSDLVKKAAVYASINSLTEFLTKVREITAQFELQRVSLGAIINDQVRANQLFSEIKQFALKSPIKILDLTKYTKQLAAFRFETDKLFDTTKRVADISVGLSVPMDRLVLALGHVKASSYLTGITLRQFSMAGIPMLELLAERFTELEGRAVSTSDVLKRVHDKAVSFEDVNQIFINLTSTGGMFYNMQEKQGNTLYGMWAKLGDAASIMYDEIGNTDIVNAGMKQFIQLMTETMRNWRSLALTIAVVAGAYGVVAGAIKIVTIATKANTIAIQANTLASIKMRLETIKSNTALSVGYKTLRFFGIGMNKATAYTIAFSNALKLIGTISFGVLIAGLSWIIEKAFEAHEKANRLKNSLKEIAEESGIEQMKSVRNFEALANEAVKAADGSRKQKEALSELSRTYKDIIPQERLTIENLRDMKGNYDSITQSIKDYIAEQMKQKQVNSILDITGKGMIEKSREIQDIMKDIWSAEQIARYMTAYEQIIRDNPAIFAAEAMKKAAEDTGIGWNNMLDLGAITRDKLAAALRSFSKTLKEQVTQVNALEVAWSNNYAALGRYGIEYEKMANKIKDNPISVGGSPNIDENKTPYLFKQQQQNLEILQAMIPTLKKIMSDANVTWQDGWANIVTTIDEAQPQIISSIDFDAINKYLKENLGALDNEQRMAINKLQGLYYNLGIPDEVVRHNRQIVIDLANSMNESLSKLGNGSRSALDNVTKYFQESGQSVNDYVKTLQDALKALKARIAEIEAVGLLMSAELRKELEDKKIEAELLTKLIDRMSTAVTSDKSKKTTSDNRLQTLNEIEQTLTKINQKYEELLKKEGQTKALADIQKIYGDTLKYINSLGEKFKLTFDMPTDFTSLQDYRKAIQKVIETLKMKGHEKAALELQTKIDTGNIDQLQTQIDKKLKELSERISRTKTAREFYDKILSQTGDVDLAANVTMSIYGDTGEGLFDATIKQIQEIFKSNNPEVEIDLSSVIDMTNQRINYGELGKLYERYQNVITEANRNTAENIIKEGQKTAAANISNWENELAKAKSYEEQRTDIIKRETQRRADIYKSEAPQEEKDRLAAQSRKKQDEEVAKLNFEEFTKSEDYIKIFENLDNTSTAALKRLREEMQMLIETNHELSPENMKTLVKAMEDIDEQISGRGFGHDMVQGVRDYISAMRDLKTAKEALKTSQAEYEAQLPQLDADIEAAKQEEIAAQEALNALKAQEVQDVNAIVAAELRLNAAITAVTNAERKKAEAADKVKKAEKEVTDNQDKQKKATNKFLKDMQNVAAQANKLAGLLGDVKDLLGISEDSAAGIAFDAAIGSLQTMSKAIEVAATAQAVFNAIANANPYIAIASGVLAVGTAITSWISGNKVRKANKEIERQKNLVEDLEYVYGRLEKAADKAFGVDYGANYKKQLANLQAQQTAYLKMAEAERSKGKKADDAKIKEYENSARETADAIKELMEDLAQHFAGVSLTDAARQMAKSWIDAKASMSDTWAAIKDNYSEWIKNMIVEGAAARIVENALTPMWEQMDKRLQANDPEGAIKVIMDGMDAVLSDANRGLEVLWKRLEASGYNLKEMLGETNSAYSGIKREVAGATSEEMNANTAALNTQNYYLSQVPGIAANVALIRQYMESGNTTVTPTGWTDWQTQAMSNYEAVKKNTADTVVECRRAAVAAEAAVAELRRVITVKGSKHGFQVYM